MLDRLSQGRVILGMGRGFRGALFTAFEVPPEEKRDRFEAALQVMRRAWAGEAVAWEAGVGEAAPPTPVHVAPLPVQQPHPPLWVAAFGPKAVEQAGRLALPYLASPIESLAALEANYARHREALAGASVAVPVMRTLFVSRDAARVERARAGLAQQAAALAKAPASSLRRAAAADVADWAIVGEPDEVAEGDPPLPREARRHAPDRARADPGARARRDRGLAARDRGASALAPWQRRDLARAALEAQQALLVDPVRQPLALEPLQLVRLIALAQRLARLGHQQEAHVEVQMRGLAAVRRNRMDVEIERQRIGGVGQEAEALEPRFFARLAQRDLARVALAVGVAPELEPASELAMVGEQRLAVIGREDPRRRRDVSLAAAALEAIRMRQHEAADAPDDLGVVGASCDVACEQIDQEPAVHAQASVAAGAGAAITGAGAAPNVSLFASTRYHSQRAPSGSTDQTLFCFA